MKGREAQAIRAVVGEGSMTTAIWGSYDKDLLECVATGLEMDENLLAYREL